MLRSVPSRTLQTTVDRRCRRGRPLCSAPDVSERCRPLCSVPDWVVWRLVGWPACFGSVVGLRAGLACWFVGCLRVSWFGCWLAGWVGRLLVWSVCRLFLKRWVRLFAACWFGGCWRMVCWLVACCAVYFPNTYKVMCPLFVRLHTTKPTARKDQEAIVAAGKLI